MTEDQYFSKSLFAYRSRQHSRNAKELINSWSMNSGITKVVSISSFHRITVSLQNVKPLGTAHGFAARPNLEIPEVEEAYEKAFQQTVDWFKKTLPS